MEWQKFPFRIVQARKLYFKATNHRTTRICKQTATYKHNMFCCRNHVVIYNKFCAHYLSIIIVLKHSNNDWYFFPHSTPFPRVFFLTCFQRGKLSSNESVWNSEICWYNINKLNSACLVNNVLWVYVLLFAKFTFSFFVCLLRWWLQWFRREKKIAIADFRGNVTFESITFRTIAMVSTEFLERFQSNNSSTVVCLCDFFFFCNFPCEFGESIAFAVGFAVDFAVDFWEIEWNNFNHGPITRVLKFKTISICLQSLKVSRYTLWGPQIEVGRLRTFGAFSLNRCLKLTRVWRFITKSKQIKNEWEMVKKRWKV